MRIPTDPEIPTHRISSYSQAVPKVDLIYKEIELMDGHIIEPCGNKRPCYYPVIAVPKPGAAPRCIGTQQSHHCKLFWVT